MPCITSRNHTPAMLKFWKKKPAAESAAAAKPVESAHEASLDITDEVPVEPAEIDDTPIDLAITEERLVDPRLLEAAPSAPAPAAPAPAEPAKRSWRERLAGSGLSKGLGGLFARNPKLDEDLLDELETCLISADVGITASTELVEQLRKRMAKREFANADALLAALRARLVELLIPVEKPLDVSGYKPFVLLMVGVNGVGKTTTIGKIARRLLHQEHNIMLAAGDTFRAAAVEQLQSWGQRNGVHVVAQGSGADSASVIFDALQAARARKVDVLIADTAGRLHTQSGLMDELGKIRRVLGKIDGNAPHEVLMVIDGTTGQNAIAQLRHFREAIGVSGLVVTKLDGTAKGGVVFALAREFGLPIRYIGLGEGAEDLRVFNAQAFVDGLLPASLANSANSN
jgi:fused signal recognition particle receptor